MKFHEIPYEERLELFNDHLTQFSAILLRLSVVAERRKDPELDEITKKLKKAIEELRDSVLGEGNSQ